MAMAMVAVRVARSTLPRALCLDMARLTTRGLMRGRLPGVRLAGTSRPLVPAGSAAGPAARMTWSRAAFKATANLARSGVGAGDGADRVGDTTRACAPGAVDDADQAVSRAEAVKKFRILDVDFTQEDGRLSAKLGIKRSVPAGEFAGEIDALFA
jgi:hypothetical protein